MQSHEVGPIKFEVPDGLTPEEAAELRLISVADLGRLWSVDGKGLYHALHKMDAPIRRIGDLRIRVPLLWALAVARGEIEAPMPKRRRRRSKS